MNWGLKIVMALALFMVLIVSFGVYMVSQNTDTLEEYDYYEKGLDFDAVYERRQNLNVHHATPEVTIAADTLKIRFKHDSNAGELLLRRPSDHTQDTKIPLVVKGREYRLPLVTFSRGAWDLRLEWEAAGVPYGYEKRLFLD